jgi:hypothetical protein
MAWNCLTIQSCDFTRFFFQVEDIFHSTATDFASIAYRQIRRG